MRYADQQIKRPRFEKGVDYGSNNRRVLARNGPKQLLLQAGFTATSGSRDYNPTSLELWSDDLGEGKSHNLAEGKISPEIIAEQSEAIYNHLGCKFDITLLRDYLTLLLDEPGEIAEIPKKQIEKPKQYQKLPYENMWSVLYNSFDMEIATIEWKVIKQSLGKATLYREYEGNGRKFNQTVKIPTDRSKESGFFPTKEEALQEFVNQQIKDFNRSRIAIRKNIESTRSKLEDIRQLQSSIQAKHGYTPVVHCEPIDKWQHDIAIEICSKFMGRTNPTLELVAKEIKELIAEKFNSAYASQAQC